MKRFLLFLVMVACLSYVPDVAHSQAKINGVSMTNPNGLTIDTAANQTAEGPTYHIPGKYDVITFVAEITKISGTLNGTIALQGANRSGQYTTLATATNLSDATANYAFKETDKGYIYYRVLITAAASGSGQVSYRVTMNGYPSK